MRDMNPNEFVRALIDGTTRFVITYLTFVGASLKSPGRFYARQYYRSYIATDREISASGFLAVTVLVIVFVSPLLSGRVRYNVGFTKYAMNLSTSADLTLSVVAAAIATTLFIEMMGRLVFARVFIHVARTRRFQRIWLLAVASSAVWAWIVFWLLFWATKIWPPAHDACVAPWSVLTVPLITASVVARQLTPLTRYMRQCRDRKCRGVSQPRLRSRIIRPALLVPLSAALLCITPVLFVAMTSALLPATKQLSIMHLACDSVTPPHEPIRGSIMIANNTPNGASFYASFHLLVHFAGGRFTPLVAVMDSDAGTNMLHLKVDDVGVYRFAVHPPAGYRAAPITLRPADCIGIPPTTLPGDPAYQD